MKKRAFTMVELIFVIVILGILAAVAVPKLNASREDAEIAKFAANLATIYKDVQTYYLANGTVFTDETKTVLPNSYADISKITNVPLVPDKSVGNGLIDGYSHVRKRLQIGGQDCLLIGISKDGVSGESIEIIRVKKPIDEENPLCAKMWERAAENEQLNALFSGLWAWDLTVTKSLATADQNTAICYRPLSAGAINFD